MKLRFVFILSLTAVATSFAMAGPDEPRTKNDFLLRGKEVALKTRDVLGKHLQQAMHDGGPLAAVDFCNENAQAITNETSGELNTTIARVSDRPRNSNNTANKDQLAYITEAKRSLASGEQPKPALVDIDGRMVGYYPILTRGMCLQCHGTEGREISQETSTAIRARYPADQAVGYGVNELRGIFVVTMQKN
ncbi:MAG: hypothetical protein ACI8RN_001721 [Glaciecola sp.]|jgi:hypothetical protein|uniref:c-type heme family protein n=1 Tax=Congregibacter sp. TaxID=2744308 RepID=UPI0039E5ECBD